MIKSCRPKTRIDSKRTTTTSEKRTRNNRQNVELCACRFDMGSFTYDVITLGGGGGFQMMTIDDEGEGGCFGQ